MALALKTCQECTNVYRPRESDGQAITSCPVCHEPAFLAPPRDAATVELVRTRDAYARFAREREDRRGVVAHHDVSSREGHTHASFYGRWCPSCAPSPRDAAADELVEALDELLSREWPDVPTWGRLTDAVAQARNCGAKIADVQLAIQVREYARD